MATEVSLDNDMYLASVDDFLTVTCFLTDEEMRFGLKKVHNPYMDF